jgi:uncharacterized membrane protein (DUF485 family)
MPAPDLPQPPTADHRAARYGLWLCGLYVLLYAGFIALTVFGTDVMARPVAWGLNLAIVYGWGLIAAAMVLALVYAALCRRFASAPRRAEDA